MSSIRIGTVSSVDVKSRTARVFFGDRRDMVSADLKVLRSSPLITADITTGGTDWEISETYASAPRELQRGESYDKEEPDVIEGELASKDHHVKIEVHGWLPYIGQGVLCIIPDGSEGGGFIIGGI